MEWYIWVITIGLGLGLGLIMNKNKSVKTENIHPLSKDDFYNNLRKGHLVDIRKKDQFTQDKIKGARNFTVGQLSGKYPKVRKDQSVFLYCSNGKKSKRLAKKLSSKEFTAIYYLEDGFDNL